MIGAVVGVQPFGGERLSGTGPKAGGPRYLSRFATERTISIDTTAAGGNATLLILAGRLLAAPAGGVYCRAKRLVAGERTRWRKAGSNISAGVAKARG